MRLPVLYIFNLGLISDERLSLFINKISFKIYNFNTISYIVCFIIPGILAANVNIITLEELCPDLIIKYISADIINFV